MTHALGRVFVVLATALFVAYDHAAAVRITRPGVVVEEVSKGSAGEKAGILAGDVLVAWERPASPSVSSEETKGRIESAFDWLWVEMEQGPRGTLSVTGERDGKEIGFNVPMGNWGVKVRPRFDDEAVKIYIDGRAALGSKQLEKAMALWGDVVKFADAAGDADVALWMNLRIGETWAEARRWKEADAAYESARERSEIATNVTAQSAIWEAIGTAFERQGRLGEAEKAYQSLIAVRERVAGESVSVARALINLGVVAYARRDSARAETNFRRALALQETLAPDSLDLARSLNNLAILARDRSDLATADSYHSRALVIREKLAPGSLDVARSLNNLGNVAWSRGELATAEIYYKRALAIQEQLAPASLDVSASHNNLGMVSLLRGELAAAEVYYKHALAIQETLAPNSLGVANSLNNLGSVPLSRGELATAEVYYKRAMAIQAKVAPDSIDLARSVTNLGIVARNRGELASAEAYHQRALAIWEKLSSDGLDVALALTNLGIVARDRREFASAETYYKRAMAIQEKVAPDSLDLARSLNDLGGVVRDSGNLAAAEVYYKRALAIREKLSPGSMDEAKSHHDLALVYRQTDQIRPSADHFRRAIEALETQVGKLGGSQETQSDFRAQFADYYREFIDLLVEQHQQAAAFQVLERSRARTLLAMLAERDLVFTADVPEATERDRKRIAWEYDRTQARLAQLNPLKEQAQIEAALNQIRELRDRQSDIVARIRQQSPRLASLQYPQPLDVKAVQAALDLGTLVLSYSVGKDKSYLFALTRDAGVQVYPVAIGETRLREDVERFRSLIQRAPLGTTDLTGLVERGRQLYDVLMQPAAKMVAAATRVLVVPDGPLHALPFSALVRGVEVKTAGARRDWEYLIEWKPVHVVVSATVYSELRKARPNRGTPAARTTLVAFGDPTYPASAVNTDEKQLDRQDAVVRSMITRGYRLTPLPATKGEVAAIARLYRELAETYVGDSATEERAKSVSKHTRYLHFASHGLLDERFPLNSGLALTIPAEMTEGQDNGILQAWEIFEGLRIEADLVVLSACETGLGKEMGGEGLVGLTRAFHYAGARSVLASLWSVADDSTAALMVRFYGYLKAGRSKDAALRQAQLDLLRDAGVVRNQRAETAKASASHPFYWAAFQLSGDWR